VDGGHDRDALRREALDDGQDLPGALGMEGWGWRLRGGSRLRHPCSWAHALACQGQSPPTSLDVKESRLLVGSSRSRALVGDGRKEQLWEPSHSHS
jgi:hypothetical protein